MLAGEVYMTGCVCVDTSLFGLDLGVGLYFHVRACHISCLAAACL